MFFFIYVLLILKISLISFTKIIFSIKAFNIKFYLKYHYIYIFFKIAQSLDKTLISLIEKIKKLNII